jgi:hypothetical protein
MPQEVWIEMRGGFDFGNVSITLRSGSGQVFTVNSIPRVGRVTESAHVRGHAAPQTQRSEGVETRREVVIATGESRARYCDTVCTVYTSSPKIGGTNVRDPVIRSHYEVAIHIPIRPDGLASIVISPTAVGAVFRVRTCFPTYLHVYPIGASGSIDGKTYIIADQISYGYVIWKN